MTVLTVNCVVSVCPGPPEYLRVSLAIGEKQKALRPLECGVAGERECRCGMTTAHRVA